MSKYPPLLPGILTPVMHDLPQMPRTVDQLVRPASPPTSRAAAVSIVNNLTVLQQRVLGILRESGPWTDDSLIAAYRLCYGYVSESTVRSRRAELVEAGLVRSVGTVAGRTGKQVTRWAVTDSVAPDGAGGV
jgi:hypothetical protein